MSAPSAMIDAGRSEAADGPLAHIHEHPELDLRDLLLIERLAGTGCRLLDVGAGRGGFVLSACGRGMRALALDIECAAPAIWRRRAVPGVLGSAFQLPLDDGQFDVVRLKELVEHVENPLRLLLACARAIRPGGWVIVHVPSPYSQFYPIGNFWDDYTHVRPMSRTGLRRLAMDAGLHVQSVDGYTAGRNRVERVAGRFAAILFPHTYRLVAAKP